MTSTFQHMVQKPGRHCLLYRTTRHRPVAGRQHPTGEKGWGNSGPVTRASLHSSPATVINTTKKKNKKKTPFISPLSLGYSDIFCVPREGRRTHSERSILPVHWTCDLELCTSFCQAFNIHLHSFLLK